MSCPFRGHGRVVGGVVPAANLDLPSIYPLNVRNGNLL